MKQKRKQYGLILCCAALVTAFLFSCARGSKVEDTSATHTTDAPDPDAMPLSSARIVISDRAGTNLRDCARRLAVLIRDLTGETVPVREDSAYAESTDIREILIGNTNRSGSAEALRTLSGEGYVIQNAEGAVVINGSTEEMTVDAVEYFLHNIVRKTASVGGIRVPKDYRIISSYAAVDMKQDVYTILYSDSLDDEKDAGFVNDGLDIEVWLAMNLQQKLSEMGIRAEVASDKESPVEREFLIGSTNRAESRALLNDMDGTQYGIGCRNGKLVVAGHSAATTVMAVERFLEQLKESDSRTLMLGAGSIRSNTDWVLNAPFFADGVLLGAQESGAAEVMLCYGQTSDAAVSSYTEKLLQAGYRQIFANTIEENRFVSLENGKTRIYLSYSGKEGLLRLFAGKPDAILYPLDSEAAYEPCTAVSVTQIQLDYSTNSGGMGYIVTLEDGSFLMIDSGSTTSKSAVAQGKENRDHVRIWTLLNQLNQRRDKKIIIRGWIITHEHSDHIWVFRKFCETYGNQVTIERFYSCSLTESVAFNSKNPEYHVANGEVGKLAERVGGGMQFTALHSGMKFSLYGVTLEILYTAEDLYPTRLHYFNDASTVFTLSVPNGRTDGKYQVLFTGDIFTDACRVLMKRYTAVTLKSDIVQVSHHGNQGATKAFYTAVDPSVALWPTSQELFEELVSEGGNASYYVIDRYLYTQMNVRENYTNSAYSVELTLPYALGTAKKHKI